MYLSTKTTGAKLFSSHAGAPTEHPLLDTDPELYEIQKAQKAPFTLANKVCSISTCYFPRIALDYD